MICAVGGDEARTEFLPEPASVSLARRFVREALSSWHLEDCLDTATLLTSELATNAVLHARTTYVVLVDHDEAQVRIEVRDGSAGLPTLRHSADDASTGRGVALVEQLATSWGIAPAREEGYLKGVWFTLPVQGDPEAAWATTDWLAGTDEL